MHLLKYLGARLVSTVTPQPNAAPSPSPTTGSVTTPFASDSEPLPHSTTCSISRQATIEELSDKVLLNIFCYFLDDSPGNWPTLMHICRKWRRIVFASQQPLQLRLFCTHAMPVLKTLDFWPTLPIVVQYGGSLALDPPAPEDEDTIMAALKHSERVTSISLTVTTSLLKKISAITEPFSELEDLVLVSQGGMQLTLPSAFQRGPHLRRSHSTRIAFPALGLLQLLYSSKNLVNLHLHEVLHPSVFPPEALTNAFSGMVQLRSLSLHFPSIVIPVNLPPPASEKLAVLPALTCLNFTGRAEYLEGLVSRMDAPLLGDFKLTFLNIAVPDLPELRKFTDRIGTHKSHHRADILASELSISVSLTRPGDSTCLKFQSSRKLLSEQLYFLSRICLQFSAFLLNVEDLRINAQRPLGWGDIRYTKNWLQPIRSCRSLKWLHISENLATLIAWSLQLPDMKNVLPALHKLSIKLCVRDLGPRHSLMRESVVSLLESRRLSGRLVTVEYERIRFNELSGTGPLFQQATIERLSDDILLNVFRQYLDDTPHVWPMLGWVCQRWRQILVSSPLGLNLRLYCTYGTPVLKALDFWPALPIIVWYGGVPNLDPPPPQDDDNIIAALKQSHRVSSITLTVTESLLKKLSAISEPLSELEDLSLQSFDIVQPILPSTFRWGPLLRTLHSTRIAFPSFPQLLSPSPGLVDLQLHEIPSSGYFSPEEFANALSGMTHLRNLSLHFRSLPPRRIFLRLPPQPGERIVLPALTCLKYRGTSKYLDSFVARIDAPLLEDIDITFFCQPTIDASQLGRFIERIEMQTLLSQAEVETSAHAISVSFTNSSTSTRLQLRISCKKLHWKLSGMAQVCDQFSPFLFRVEELLINSTQSLREQDDVADEQWLDLLRSFGGTRDFWMANELTTVILRALGEANGRHITVLPALCHMRIENPAKIKKPSWDVLLSFITSRSRSGCPVQVNVPLFQCYVCHAAFRQEKELERHLEGEHAYRSRCSYCANFEWTPGHNNLFREHIESEHPEVASKDALIWSPLLARSLPFQLESLLKEHSSFRAPDIVATPMVTAPHSQSSGTPTPVL